MAITGSLSLAQIEHYTYHPLWGVRYHAEICPQNMKVEIACMDVDAIMHKQQQIAGSNLIIRFFYYLFNIENRPFNHEVQQWL